MAKQLLSENLSKISEISERCGFSSVYHFSRAFSIRVGMTPSEYAKQNNFLKYKRCLVARFIFLLYQFIYIT